MTRELCKVCGGKGFVDIDSENWIYSINTKCQNCNGEGWIGKPDWILEEEKVKTLDIDKCIVKRIRTNKCCPLSCRDLGMNICTNGGVRV
jgi:DNA replicative helicase MCM subunit Mcm2 (Cdc46/Mcm family)